MIPLEDNFNDILGKAQRGLKLSDEELAQRAGVSVGELTRAKAGEFDESSVHRLAPALKLGADALIALGKKSWYPKDPGNIDGLSLFNTVYGDITVNAFAVWDPKSNAAALFDTGADATEMLELVQKQKLTVGSIFLTHTHADHIADLAKLKAATGAKAWVCELESIPGAEPFVAGKSFSIGGLRVETRQTSGHSRGGITYVISGLARPVAVVGDSIFASSMGGGSVSFDDALRNNREQILTLPENTILCPGHGPMTTVGEEKLHNPFFA